MGQPSPHRGRREPVLSAGVSHGHGGPIYSDGVVTVTRTLVRIGDTSYPVNGIGSVLIRTARRADPTLYYIGSALSAALAFGVGLGSERPEGTAETALMFGVIAAALFAVAFKKSMATPDTTLVLRTASGDQSALVSKDVQHIRTVKAAIEEAVVQRG